MKLIVIRHAKSSWKHPEVDDFDRPLKKRGKDDIKLMGKWLKEKGLYPDIVFCSTAKRAKKTCKILEKVLNFDEDRAVFKKSIYEASVKDLLRVLSKAEKNKTVFLIGHNPSLTQLAEYLSSSIISNIPTSGVVILEFEGNDWSDIEDKKGKILFFEYPKKLKEVKC